MEKTLKKPKSSKASMSKTEYRLIEKIRENRLVTFSSADVQILLGCKQPNASNTIKNLIKKGLLVRIQKGKYILGMFSEQPNILEVASEIHWPSYISFWTALQYYKMTEQMPTTIFIVTTKAKPEIEFDNKKIKFVSLSLKRFFGYTPFDNITIAEKEKAIIDSLLLPRYAGGVKEVFKCLYNSFEELDKKKLVDYAIRMQNKSMLKRIGFLLEKTEFKVEGKLLRRLNKLIGRGYSLLDPELGKPKEYNKKWQLIINVKNLFDWRMVV